MLGSDHVVTLETTDSAPAVIASIIGLAEGTVDSGELATELTDAGFDSGVALAAVKSATGIDVTKHGVGVAVADTTYGDLKL